MTTSSTTEVTSDGLNTLALLFGIASLVVPFVGMLTAPLAVAFAATARKRGAGGLHGTTGMVLGVVAIVLYGLFSVMMVLGVMLS